MTLRHKALTLALAAPLLLGGCGWLSSLRARAAYQDGNKEYKNENYRQAIVKYEEAVQLDPALAEAWFYLANSNQALYRPNKPDQENLERLQTALGQYKKSLEVNEADSEVLKQVRYNTLGALVQIYSEDPHKDFEQASTYAQELVKDAPDEIKNLFALGGLYEKFEKYDDAEGAYRRAVAQEPESVKTWNALATFYNKAYWDGRSRFDDAIGALEKAAELAPEDETGYYKIGTFYWDKAYRDQELTDEEKENYAEKGLAAVDQALSINPDYCDALIYRNLLLRIKAQVAKNMRQRARLLDEADAVRKLAVECKKQATEAEQAQSLEEVVAE